MKKLFKFAPLCALLLAIVAFILLLAGQALVHDYQVLGQSMHDFYSGPVVLFGQGDAAVLGTSVKYAADDGIKSAWNAILAFIFIIVALVALLLSSVMVFVKIKALEKFGGLIALIAGGLLLVAGIFIFFTVPAFFSANELGDTKNFALGGGWVVAAILAILGGVASACPAVLALVEKK